MDPYSGIFSKGRVERKSLRGLKLSPAHGQRGALHQWHLNPLTSSSFGVHDLKDSA